LGDLRPGGMVVVIDYRIPTATTLSGAENYPGDVLERLGEHAVTCVMDAAAIARDLGNARSMNVVLLGALVKLMKLETLDWDAALAACMKPGLIELNRRALQAGMAEAERV
ncbi:MAG: 2-oxoacid:acceptor oxidoreductase family protein, partial [Clostridia bacterium]|nr:2-oxoacid:acceptor oxidoreductase family protein [Clostridia bacterium]